MKETKIIKVKNWSEIPTNFTGIIEYSSRKKEWHKEGKTHREGGPAIIMPNGTKAWCKDGNLHRENKPAVEYSDGAKCWYKKGKYHRLDGPAVEYPSGDKYWYLDETEYFRIKLKDHIILDSYKGKYNLTWYKLLTKDKVIECPDIPGLIEK